MVDLLIHRIDQLASKRLPSSILPRTLVGRQPSWELILPPQGYESPISWLWRSKNKNTPVYNNLSQDSSQTYRRLYAKGLPLFSFLEILCGSGRHNFRQHSSCRNSLVHHGEKTMVSKFSKAQQEIQNLRIKCGAYLGTVAVLKTSTIGNPFTKIKCISWSSWIIELTIKIV